ncbi:alpha/beta fold hydrolase [Pseudonocardia asaccharolytica]|uniref:Alpha/beta hydrolase n=1 Tax=Pseudonocardia asaccharolytica DSM 44247 = NBRC 16224 TaxID=1123024 RepID=A0A511D6I8_9PSEU|nr:alpha/beta hydrolase [Pseudonocardia asaccharolytica]GEL20382.1 alpha/beta hydrolase [Pseudonocardia asaccharolytica DSM 44247 = NBRC 16224]
MAETFVLIPGAGGSGWYWHRLVEELDRRGCEAVAVTLPADDDSAGLVEYADAVIEAIDGRTGLVLVAQSMGGFTAPLVCERVPVDLLVLLNAMVPAPGESPGEWWANTGHTQARAEQAARDGRSLAEEDLVADVFFHDVPPEVTAAAMAAGAPDQSETPFTRPWPLPAWPDVPTRFLQGRDDRFFPLEFQRRIARARLGIDVDEMPGGHLVALSRPTELADRLGAYLAFTVDRASIRDGFTQGHPIF